MDHLEKLKIKQNIRKLKIKLKLEELSVEDITGRVEKYKNMCSEIADLIQSISWSLSKADLIYSYEQQKRSHYYQKIKKSNMIFHRPESTINSKRSFDSNVEFRRSLDLVKKRNCEKRDLIYNMKQKLSKIKESNAALWQNSLIDLEEIENERRKLEEKLNEFQVVEEDCFNFKNDRGE